MAATIANLRLICNLTARKDGKEPDNALVCLFGRGMRLLRRLSTGFWRSQGPKPLWC